MKVSQVKKLSAIMTALSINMMNVSFADAQVFTDDLSSQAPAQSQAPEQQQVTDQPLAQNGVVESDSASDSADSIESLKADLDAAKSAKSVKYEDVIECNTELDRDTKTAMINSYKGKQALLPEDRSYNEKVLIEEKFKELEHQNTLFGERAVRRNAKLKKMYEMQIDTMDAMEKLTDKRDISKKLMDEINTLQEDITKGADTIENRALLEKKLETLKVNQAVISDDVGKLKEIGSNIQTLVDEKWQDRSNAINSLDEFLINRTHDDPISAGKISVGEKNSFQKELQNKLEGKKIDHGKVTDMLNSKLASVSDPSNFLQGDQKDACEAILCLSAGTQPTECISPLEKFFSLPPDKQPGYLLQCPDANSTDETASEDEKADNRGINSAYTFAMQSAQLGNVCKLATYNSRAKEIKYNKNNPESKRANPDDIVTIKVIAPELTPECQGYVKHTWRNIYSMPFYRLKAVTLGADATDNNRKTINSMKNKNKEFTRVWDLSRREWHNFGYWEYEKSRDQLRELPNSNPKKLPPLPLRTGKGNGSDSANTEEGRELNCDAVNKALGHN